MKASINNVFEFLDILMMKVDSIEKKLSGKPDEFNHKEYMNVSELLEYLKKERAITISISKLYKLTSCTSGGIPHRKVYGKLVFKKQEIDVMVETQLNPLRTKGLARKTKARIK